VLSLRPPGHKSNFVIRSLGIAAEKHHAARTPLGYPQTQNVPIERFHFFQVSAKDAHVPQTDYLCHGPSIRPLKPTLALVRSLYGMRKAAVMVLAATAIGLVPLWPHIVLVDSGIDGIISVFREVAVYPSDACLALLVALSVRRPPRLDSASRWLAFGLTLLSGAALLSTAAAPDRALAGGLAAQLALLTLAWLAVRSGHVTRTTLVAALVASAAVQSGLAAAQFITQRTLLPPQLGLPWLPSDGTQGGAPVILDSAGDRLLRGFGTFPHPNVLGGYLAIALVCLPLLHGRWPRKTPLLWATGALLTLGLLASFSRAAWLAAVVGLGISWWMGARQGRPHRWLPVMVGGAALVGVGLTPVATLVEPRLFPFGPNGNALERGSIQDRLALDGAAVLEIADHWPRGMGGGNYGLVSVTEGYQEGWGEPVPNVALLIAAELGLPGVFALALLLFATLRLISLESGADVAVTACVVAVIVLAMFDHYLWTMPLGRVIAWTPFALLAARPDRQAIAATPTRKSGACGLRLFPN
jgi:hypothetical protein